MTEEYIDSHFEEIKAHASDIETRMDDSCCTADQLKRDNRRIIDGFKAEGERIDLITERYEDLILFFSQLRIV